MFAVLPHGSRMNLTIAALQYTVKPQNYSVTVLCAFVILKVETIWQEYLNSENGILLTLYPNHILRNMMQMPIYSLSCACSTLATSLFNLFPPLYFALAFPIGLNLAQGVFENRITTVPVEIVYLSSRADFAGSVILSVTAEHGWIRIDSARTDFRSGSDTILWIP
ncbi:uncharacterized protein BDR25DRAFT_350618 [Lindgomyces ingoldianus]|uniref:Uncharacterized protein n=1 Tax=Lindgomyces ingoldianus TaxID=673940 RepID=A0ACB6R7G2_9PLEO|nr:uncharacterized protein BDR25DRAFT_350618 [Lindgomyces ingoldianus]KAF2475213.1 hypothetical protein BDR25DRAFT_350618 [Lindgomyces ingoldianus]